MEVMHILGGRGTLQEALERNLLESVALNAVHGQVKASK